MGGAKFKPPATAPLLGREMLSDFKGAVVVEAWRLRDDTFRVVTLARERAIRVAGKPPGTRKLI